MKEVVLPSGATLTIDEAPFEDALELNDAVNDELKSVGFSFNKETGKMVADAVLILSSSKRVRACINKVSERCLYNGARMTGDFWKSGKGKKEDYFPACKAIAEENIVPFEKSLYAEFTSIVSKLVSSPA